MDWLTFSDHVIGHLAWPAAVAGLVVFLSVRHRTALDALLHRLRKAKAGPFEAELDAAEAAADAAGLPPAPPLPPSGPEEIEPPSRPKEIEPPSGPEEWIRRCKALADTAPRKAILDAYLYLNGYLSGISKAIDPERIRYTEPAITREAVAILLAPQHADLLARLRDAAVSALEDEEVSPRQAKEYVDLVARLLFAVRSGRKALPE